MSPSLFPVLLLVALLGGIAHARHIPLATDLAQRPVTSSIVAKDASSSSSSSTGIEGASSKKPKQHQQQQRQQSPLETPHSRQNLLSIKDNGAVGIRPPSSVVQDWSLVCQQLCGAGLGGAPCAVHCSDSDALPHADEHREKQNVDTILNSNKDLICHELCRLQLGDESCDCSKQDDIKNSAADKNANSTSTKTKTGELSMWERNAVCSCFCVQNGATLTGCSLCSNGGQDINADGSDSGSKDDDSKAIATELIKVGVVNGDQGKVVPRGSNDDSTSSTPDWNQLCASLCRTGDGGSLCNCDLSPFF